ncbi:hypothetical protein [uncultured Gimesia sp.]|uniref:hypothetical protein n=1 Tax=uncultured Gimesia sp. TaxID=1678688 RepID=UPI0030D9EF2A|tara:strand:- start:101770 stop:102123 length:354 start_codon:yes stop_codon:yes gene_type:complete
MWYFLQLVAAIFFCCIGGSMNQAGGHEGGHFRRCVEVRSSGSERVPCRVDGAPIRIDSVAKNGVQTAVDHFLQVMISETSPLNLVRDDQLVSLVQVMKVFVLARDTRLGKCWKLPVS